MRSHEQKQELEQKDQDGKKKKKEDTKNISSRRDHRQHLLPLRFRRSPILLPLLLLHRPRHPVHHKPAGERAVHPLERDDLPQNPVPDPRPRLDDGPGVEDADPVAVAPRVDRRPRPVRDRDVGHLARGREHAAVLLDGDEVGVGPLVVEELQALALRAGERRRQGSACLSRGVIRPALAGGLPLAPRRDHQRPPGGQRPRHLLDVPLFICHVLPRLARPHEVEGPLLELEREGVHDAECDVLEALGVGELGGARDLKRERERVGCGRERGRQ